MNKRPRLIVGAGYCGSHAAKVWTDQGYQVWATTRDSAHADALEKQGVHGLVVDFDGDEAFGEQTLPGEIDIVISVPPSRDEPGGAREGRIAEWLFSMTPDIHRIVYWSATSVYPDDPDEVVDGESATGPTSARGQRRLDGEEAFLDECFKRGIAFESLRLVGIYGPHRTKRSRIAQGNYRFPSGGKRLSNRIHRDDVVSATEFILELPAQTRNWVVSDGNPFRAVELIEFIVEHESLPMPEEVALSELSERKQSFWRGSRALIPRRLQELGWSPIYETYREGLIASWAEESG